jgi:hypothetical protein
MVDADLKARFAAADVRLIPLGEGADFFAETITRAGGASSFVVGPPPLSASDRPASAEPDGGESHTPGAATLAAR